LEENLNYDIVSISGQNLKSGILLSGTNTYQIRLPINEGLFLLRLRFKNGEAFVKKFGQKR